MKVEGQAVARGSIETVWDALHDAVILARAIPGCQHFEVSGPGLGQFVATSTLPAIGGTYAGKLTVTEQRRPSLLRLTASATGDQGGVTADVTLRLSAGPDPPDGAGPAGATTTLVSFAVKGTATGSVAGVGTRLLASAARRLADEFFVALDEIVAGVVPEARESGVVPEARESGVVPEARESGTASVPADAAEPATAELFRAESPGPLARSGPAAGGRTALVAGVAIGLAGIIIGVLAGRRGRRGHGSSRVRA